MPMRARVSDVYPDFSSQRQNLAACVASTFSLHANYPTPNIRSGESVLCPCNSVQKLAQSSLLISPHVQQFQNTIPPVFIQRNRTSRIQHKHETVHFALSLSAIFRRRFTHQALLGLRLCRARDHHCYYSCREKIVSIQNAGNKQSSKRT